MPGEWQWLPPPCSLKPVSRFDYAIYDFRLVFQRARVDFGPYNYVQAGYSCTHTVYVIRCPATRDCNPTIVCTALAIVLSHCAVLGYGFGFCALLCDLRPGGPALSTGFTFCCSLTMRVRFLSWVATRPGSTPVFEIYRYASLEETVVCTALEKN